MRTRNTMTKPTVAALLACSLLAGACANDASQADPEPEPAAATDGGAETEEEAEPAEPFHKTLKQATASAIGVTKLRDETVMKLARGEAANSARSIADAYRKAADGTQGLEAGDHQAEHDAISAFLGDAITIGESLDAAAAAGDLSAYVAAEIQLMNRLGSLLSEVGADQDVCREVAQWTSLGRSWQQLCATTAPHGDWGADVFDTTRRWVVTTAATTDPHRIGLVAMYAHPPQARGTMVVATDLDMITGFYVASQPHALPELDATLAALDELTPPAGLEPHHAAIVNWLTERRASTERLVELAGAGASFETMAKEAVAPITIDQFNAVAAALDDDDSCGIVAALYCE